MKIGILGGTFDPVHNAHIHIANAALSEYQLDQIWFMPAKIPPHKQNALITSEQERVHMLLLATEVNPKFVVKTYELNWESVSYTYNTLCWLTKEFPKDTFFYLMGEDSMRSFPNWYQPEKIADMAEILVAERESDSSQDFDTLLRERNLQFHGAFHKLNARLLPYSSTEIRECVRFGESICEMVNRNVAEYIRVNKLYLSER